MLYNEFDKRTKFYKTLKMYSGFLLYDENDRISLFLLFLLSYACIMKIIMFIKAIKIK